MLPMLMYDSKPVYSSQQLLPLIQTRQLRFFGHVARMGDSQDTFRVEHLIAMIFLSRLIMKFGD